MVKKIVLTGGPCSGKTTTIKELENRGFPVIHEAARKVISKNKNLPLIEFQRKVFEIQLEQEKSKSDEIVFLDRGILDGVAYLRIGLRYIPQFLDSYDFRNKYDHVFLLERFPLVLDGERLESNDNEAENIHNHIFQAYSDYGYSPIRVPRMSIEERINFILNNISLKGGESENGRLL